jgi:hypothetical protein
MISESHTCEEERRVIFRGELGNRRSSGRSLTLHGLSWSWRWQLYAFYTTALVQPSDDDVDLV